MSSEEEPAAWLRTQIEARLALAREASPKTDGHWWRRTSDIGHDIIEPVGPLWAGEPIPDADGDIFGGEYIVVYDEGAPSDAQFDHIALNDPQDTIARCEAELAILDLHQPVAEGGSGWLECRECGPNNDASGILAVPGEGETFWPCATVCLLAGGYKHRPGYERRRDDDTDGAEQGQRAKMSSEEKATCPACGRDWDELPDGHSWAISFTDGSRSCQDVAPVSPEDFIAGR